MMHPHSEYGKQILEMFSSLQTAVDAAGGAVITIKSLREISAEDLILSLASNGVRFCYDKSHEDR